MVKIIFLDIDGVLNDHTQLENTYCGITPRCVNHFNELLEAVPDAKIVVSSAWRYLIHSKYMTIKGFENMMLTHGLNCHNKFIGATKPDCDPYEPRENQILDWLVDMPDDTIFVVLDDMNLEVSNFVRTNGGLGLTMENVNLAISILNVEPTGR